MRYFGQMAKSKRQKAEGKGQKNKRTKNKEQKKDKRTKKQRTERYQAGGGGIKKIRSEGIGANTSTKRDKLEKNVIHYSLQFRSLFIITITFYSLLQHFLFIITTENHLFFSCNYTIL